ncbi:MAG TPA: apolipoprotein N-acyltransferase [Jiangellaceae bacterium]|nr:apolipoprotein N-acyltransferase [Jiangellaceae bacterium]
MKPLARAVAAAVTGAALILAFPPYDLWFVAVVVTAGFALLVRERSMREAAVLGLCTGLGFFVPFLPWIGQEVGPVPWLLLAGLQGLFFVPLGVAVMLVQRLPGWPVWTAAAWVAQEALRGRVPYGGLTWGKLAFSQADGPTLGLASVGGSPVVSFAVALAGGLLAWAVVDPRTAVRLLAPAVAVCVVAVGAAVPTPDPRGPTVTVAVVQGNVPELGLDFNEERRRITRNNAEVTDALADDVATGRARQPDLVVWPENSVDIDPYADAQTRAEVSRAVDAIAAPTLIGALVPTADGRNVENTSIVWEPGDGAGQTYVKRHPMPFGEYIPFRSIARRITSAVERQPRDFVAGDEVGLLEMGPSTMGAVICFEVAFDNLVRDAVRAGADLVAVQTNNATFGFTPMTEQQLAMARLRAVEHHRTVLVAALAGVSAIVGPDGTVGERAELYTQDVLVADVDLSQTRTAATTLGEWPEWVLVAMAVAASAMAVVGWRRRIGDEAHRAATPVETADVR